MIPKINKILYTTDLSVNATYVFRYALSSAEKHDAKIVVLHALERAGVMGFRSSIVDTESTVEKIRKRIEALADRERRDKPSLLNRVSEIRVIEGNPVDVILQTAEDIESDIIIMGTHSKGIVAQTVLGSVAMKVLQRSRIPVYVIPIPALPASYVESLNRQQEK
jgi:nucleotide-binding universal stress UspA family protein